MATEKEVSSALKQLMDYFTPKDMSKDKIDIYRQQLAAMDSGTLEQVVAKCLITQTFFPRLNEMFKIASELPVDAQSPNQLRAVAFDLERKRAQGEFDGKEWQRLADSFGRLHKQHARQAVLRRMEAYSC